MRRGSAKERRLIAVGCAGYVGPSCVHICETNPCQNGGECVDDGKSTKGYECVCDKALYTGKCDEKMWCARRGSKSDHLRAFVGEYCEIEIEQGCPSSWWGHPVCGPCNCAIDRGYSPDCNRTTGECRCKVGDRE